MVVTASKEIKCSVCGAVSRQEYIVKSATNGESDLDLRPSEPHRSSMKYWTTTCSECGYCSDDIEKAIDVTRDFIESDKYRTLDGIATDSELAGNFIKKALVKTQAGELEDAFQSYIYASWVFDDLEDAKNATECRNRAISLIDEFLKENQNPNYEILKSDLLRRAGRFEDVIKHYSDKSYGKQAIDAIIQFEVQKSEAKDSKVYKFSDIKITVRK